MTVKYLSEADRDALAEGLRRMGFDPQTAARIVTSVGSTPVVTAAGLNRRTQ